MERIKINEDTITITDELKEPVVSVSTTQVERTREGCCWRRRLRDKAFLMALWSGMSSSSF